MRYYALVEDWPGESMLFFRELPGCFSSAPTYEGAVKAAPAAISNYLNWLKKNDLTIVENERNEIVVVVKERLSAVREQGSPRFEADLPPPDEVEIDNALNIAAVARTDLLELYESVPLEYRDRSTSPNGWSLTQHLKHLVEAEKWYVSRLTDAPPENPANDLSSDVSLVLFDNAMDSEIALRGLTPADCERIFLHDGEEWTAAKVLRRMVGHLREHYPWMVAIADRISRRESV